jgi:hypothetical protein
LAQHSIAVSRRGETACVLLSGTRPDFSHYSTLYIFNGTSGELTHTVSYPTDSSDVTITDAGDLCLVPTNQNHIVDTRTGIDVDSLNGPVGYGRISGDGSTLVIVAGSQVSIYRRAGRYQLVATFVDPNLWPFLTVFYPPIALSRDGTTAAVPFTDYVSDYGNNVLRILDIPSGRQLGEYRTSVMPHEHPVQNIVSSVAISENGSRIAVGYLGNQYHDHPEVIVVDRNGAPLESLSVDAPTVDLDISADGRYALIASNRDLTLLSVP